MALIQGRLDPKRRRTQESTLAGGVPGKGSAHPCLPLFPIFRSQVRWLGFALVCACLCLEGCYSLKTAGRREEVVVMEVTAYCACKKCCQWKRKWGCFLLPAVYAAGPNKGKPKAVGVTADGTEAEKGTIAADTTRYPFGTIMYVPGYGWGVVHDTGKAIKGDRLDVFFASHRKALEWGRRRLRVRVYRR